MDDDEPACHMCPTTERENGGLLTWVEWMGASVCNECAHFFGIGVEGEKRDIGLSRRIMAALEPILGGGK
jgi:hypothetical protein